MREPEPEQEPRSREDFLRCSYQITLDPNTVSQHLLLSEIKGKVTGMEEVRSYCDNPDHMCQTKGPRAKCGPPGHSMWPAIASNLRCVIVSTHFPQFTPEVSAVH